MIRLRVTIVLGLLLALAGTALATLDEALAEPNLEKRSKLALDNAVLATKAAREAYRAGDVQKTSTEAEQIEKSVDLAYESLRQTGKDPRRSPKWFKRAEIETRSLLRKLEDFQQEMGFNDRGILDKVKTRIQQVHDDLLTGLMEGKKK